MNEIARITSSQINAVLTDNNIDEIDAKIIASYNWDRVRPRTVLAPGFPPMLDKAPVEYELQRDKDDNPIYSNAKFSPEFPMECVFTAVEICSPGFDFQGVDIVTDRNSLRWLLFFLDGKDEEFSILVDKVGYFLIFTRYDPTEVDGSFVGYGHNFEKQNTKYDTSYGNPGSYHCIVKYQLGKCAIVVRAEVDAVQSKGSLHPERSSDVPIAKSNPGSSLKCDQVGKLIDKATHEMYELKTCSSRNFDNFRWEDIYFQMALGSADVLMVGLHKSGTFQSVQDYRIQQVKQQFKMNTAEKFGALEKLLRWIKDEVMRASSSENHAVFQVKYQPALDKHLIINKVELCQGLVPQWIVEKYGTNH